MRRAILCAALVTLGALLLPAAGPAPAAGPQHRIVRHCAPFTTKVSGDPIRVFHLHGRNVSCRYAHEIANRALHGRLPAGWSYRVSGPFLENGELVSSGRASKGTKVVTWDMKRP